MLTSDDFLYFYYLPRAVWSKYRDIQSRILIKLLCIINIRHLSPSFRLRPEASMFNDVHIYETLYCIPSLNMDLFCLLLEVNW